MFFLIFSNNIHDYILKDNFQNEISDNDSHLFELESNLILLKPKIVIYIKNKMNKKFKFI